MCSGEQKGSITIFLSLTCMLFLALICTVIESARIQGAKAQTANMIGMGNLSLLSEFEPELLERYELFAVDGAYGSGKFQIKNVKEHLENFLSLNTDPKEEGLSSLCFDPWNLELVKTSVDAYALLTDQKGEAFYQQAVSFMKQNIGLFAIEELMEYRDAVTEIRDSQKSYENQQKANEETLAGLEEQKQQKMESLESEAASEIIVGEPTQLVPVEEPENPLKEIAKLRKKSMLELVAGDKQISGKKIALRKLPSRGGLRKGTMKIEKTQSGIMANVLFREYLMRYFSCFTEPEEDGVLDYQVEYLLGGKKSDQENLKYVINRLLLLREGMNYLYCMSDPQISSQANGLAVSLTGFLGIPALTAATGQAILLAWAYGESLIDVRILLDGGKVPLNKTPVSWQLSVENLGQLAEILRNGADGNQDGMSYDGYLRVLLHMGNLSSQKMRALDLIQLDLQQNGGLPQFEVQNCVVAAKTSAEWKCRSVFLRLPAAVMGVRTADTEFSQNGSIGY